MCTLTHRWMLMALALCVPACDQVFGLDPRPGPAEVRVRHALREVRNDANGEPVIVDVVDEVQVPTVQLADHSSPIVTVFPDGQFSFLRADDDQPYRIAVSDRLEYQFATPEIDLGQTVIGRFDPQHPGDATVTQFVPNAPAATTSYLVTTGLWTQTPHHVPPTPSSSINSNTQFTFLWRDAHRLFGEAGTLYASERDRAYVTSHARTTSAGGSPHQAVTHACENTFMRIGTLGDPVSCNVTPIARDRCTNVRVHHTAEFARIASALDAPADYPMLGYSWAVRAVPAPTVTPRFGLNLAYKLTFASMGDTVTDWNERVEYANPFPGHAISLMVRASRERQVTAPGETPATLAASVSHWLAPDTTCSMISEALPSVAIAGQPTFNGIPLGSNDQLVSIDDTQELVLAWALAAAGNADYHAVSVHEIKPFFGKTLVELVQTYVTTSRTVVVDPALLQSDKVYIVEIETYLGHPGAATGELATIAYPAQPYALSVNWSSTFRITR